MSAMPSVAATPLPAFAQIEPVGQCNLRCRMCPVAYRGEGGPGKPSALMPYETFREIVDAFPALAELQLQGMGEPFLHPRFFEMVRYAVARGVTVSTNTNLTALSERRAAQCIASGLQTLHVSIDAADPAVYAYIRAGAQLGRVLRNLARLMEAKARLNSHHPEVILVAVAMRRNLEQLPALVRLAHDHGVRSVAVQHLAHDFSDNALPARYQPMRAFVDRETLLEEDPARVDCWFEAARDTAARLGVDLRLPNITPPAARKRAHPRCDWPWRGAYVSYSGLAMPCCMIGTPDRCNFGNMAEHGVDAVWNSEGYEAFRAQLASDDPPSICRGCAIYNGTF